MSAAPGTLRVQITSQANTAGMQQAASSLDRARASASKFIDTLKLGVGIDLGGKLVQGLAQLPQIFQEATRQGIAFLAVLESSRIAIAGMLRANSSEQFTTWHSAFAKAGDQVDALRQKARETGMEIDALLEVYSANAPLAFSAGITDLQEQLDLITTISLAVKAMGLPAIQQMQEVRALMTGNVNPRFAQVAASRGITQESWNEAKEAGRLVEYLTERFASVKEMTAVSMQGFAGLTSNLNNALTELKAAAAKPLFDALKSSFAELIQTFRSPGAQNMLRGLVGDFATLAQGVLQLVNALAKAGPVLGPLVTWLARLGATVVAIKLTELIAALGIATVAWVRKSAAVSADTAALAANAAAARANAGAHALSVTAMGGAGAGAAASRIPAIGAAAAAGWLGGSILNALLGNPGAQIADVNADKRDATAAGQWDKVSALQRQIAAAATPAEQQAARNDLEQAITALAESRRSESRDAALDALVRLGERFDKIAGKGPLQPGDKEADKRAQAAAKADTEAEALGTRKRTSSAAMRDVNLAGAEGEARIPLLEDQAADQAEALAGTLGRPKTDTWQEEIKTLLDTAAERITDPEELEQTIEKVQALADTYREIEEIKAEGAASTAEARERAYEQDMEDLEALNKATEEANEKQTEQLKEQSDYRKEIEILAARAAGDEGLAAKLERQRDLEAEILDIKKAQGLTDAEATAKAEEKFKLQDAIAAREKAAADAEAAKTALEKKKDDWTPDASVRSRTGRDDHKKQIHKDVYGRDITWAEEGTTLAERTDFSEALKPRLGESLKASSMVPGAGAAPGAAPGSTPGAGPEGAPGAPGEGDAAASAQAAAAATQAATQALGQLTTGVQGLSTQLTSLGEAATKAVTGSQEAATKAIGAANSTIAAVNSLGNSITSALNNLEARVSNLEAGL